MYKNKAIGILLFVTHILSAIVVGIIFGKISKDHIFYNSYPKHDKHINNNSISDLGNILKLSIISSIKNILLIGGFIVLFAIIIEILNVSYVLDLIVLLLSPFSNYFKINTMYIKGILAGIVELTNGLAIISSIPSKNLSLNILISSFLLGFGGLSVLFQVLGIISKSDISIKPYVFGKLFQGIISVCFTYIFINTFSFFNFNL